MTERKSAGFLLIIWLIAIGISSPLLVYRSEGRRVWLNHTEIWCTDNWPRVRRSREVSAVLAAAYHATSNTFPDYSNVTTVAMTIGNATAAANVTMTPFVTYVTYPLRTIYYTIVSVVLYFFPVFVMSVAYSLIIWKLRATRIPGERIKSEVKAQDKTRKKVRGREKYFNRDGPARGCFVTIHEDNCNPRDNSSGP